MRLKTILSLILTWSNFAVNGDYNSGGGSSLRSWQLEHELSSTRTGVTNIDDDLTYLYGQLPETIRDAALAKMIKNMRRVVINISVAGLNFFGWFFT